MTQNEFEILIQKFLQNNATEAEISQLIDWLGHRLNKEQLIDSYFVKWESEVTNTLDDAATHRMLRNLKKKLITSNTTVQFNFNWKKWSRIAAIIILPFLLGVFSLKLINEISESKNTNDLILKVGNGQKANLELQDGTSVWLNSNSTLSYDRKFNKDKRIVRISGEAFFNVAKDKSRPFIVQSGKFSVQALGTTFNFKAYPDENSYTTTLLEGSVLVSKDGLSTILRPNEKVVYDRKKDQFTKTKLLNAEYSGFWRSDKLAFEQESLENIANVLERMYRIHFCFKTENLKSIRFTGKVSKNDYIDLLKMIALSAPINYQVKDSIIYLSENSKDKPLYKK